MTQSIATIRVAVCRHYGLTTEEISSGNIGLRIARPRQVAMYLSRRMTPRSLNQIGAQFGGRDHSTVKHAINRIKTLRVGDTALDRDIRTIAASLIGSPA